MTMYRKKILLIWVLAVVSTAIFSQEKVDNVDFSIQRGFYTDPIQVSLSCMTEGAFILYTLDGSAPTITSGIEYASPLEISNTTVLRAMAYSSTMLPSEGITHTYIYLQSVLNQGSDPSGFPAQWENSSGSSIPADYEMDPEYPENDPVILHALRALPSVSIVMNIDDLFGAEGFHNNGGRNNNAQWEKACSLEFLFGDSTENYQVNAGVQPRGHNISSVVKRGFRVDFKKMYGPGKLDFPAFKNATDTTVKSSKKFDSMIMRPGFMENYTGEGYNPFLNIYVRDPMIRDLQLNISGYGTHNLMAHMYLNGLYWGLYNLTEDVEPDMLTDYFGGREEQWFITKSASKDHETGGFVEGNPERFLEFMEFIDNQDFSLDNTYSEVQEYIDVEAFAEYIFLYSFWGVGDWPDNNWIFAIHGGENPIPGRFYAWDAEKTLLENDDPQSYKHAWYSPFLTDPDLWNGKAYVSPPSRVWRSLIENDDFRMLFADRSYQLMSNNARLTDANMLAWFDKYNDLVKDALKADQKRWSDDDRRNKSPGRIFTYADVQAEIEKVKGNITDNVNKYKAAFIPHGLYPVTDPPLFSHQGGKVNADFNLGIKNPNLSGVIYYTLNGSDPRRPGGPISPAAQQGVDSISLIIPDTKTIKARVLNNGEWSPLQEATYLTPGLSNDLIITEIMYHPEDIGNKDGDNYEFVELKNVGSKSINLSQCLFTAGIYYTFPDGSSIDPGGFVVLAKEAPSFRDKYKFVPDGLYTGNLSNGGDSIVLSDPYGNIMVSCVYDDLMPWPVYADSGLYSLVTVNPNANPDPDVPSSWRLSYRRGGTPGMDDIDYLPQDYSGLLLTEIMYNPPVWGDYVENELEFVEIKNTGSDTVNLIGVHFSDGIQYTFYGDRFLAPNGFCVLVKDGPAFYELSSLFTDGEYEKSLSNSGEQLILSDPHENTLFSVQYGVSGSWPKEADGEGYSLVPVEYNFNSAPDNPLNWRASYLPFGSPSMDDSLSTHPKEVLLVVGSSSLNSGDSKVFERLESLGFDIAVKEPGEINSSDHIGKHLIIISSTVASNQVKGKFRLVNVPLINWEYNLHGDLGMTGESGNTDFGTSGDQQVIQISDPGHFLAAELSGEVSVSSTLTDMTWGLPNENAIRVAELTGSNSDKSPLFAYEKGVSMPGINAPARRVGFFLKNETASVLNESGWKLFDAAVLWAAGLEDSYTSRSEARGERFEGHLVNYPNPFKVSTTIEINLPERSPVLLGIYNINGALVEEIYSGVIESGNHEFTWNAHSMKSGLYLIKLQSGDSILVKKCMIL